MLLNSHTGEVRFETSSAFQKQNSYTTSDKLVTGHGFKLVVDRGTAFMQTDEV